MLGVQKFLQLISNNWLIIVIAVAVIVLAARIIYIFFTKSQDEQISIVKQQISQVILKLVTEAELDYAEWVSAGAVKRAQVIDAIFEQYPILSVITDQASVVAWLDGLIDDALETLRGILELNIPEEDEDIAESVATATSNLDDYVSVAEEDITFTIIRDNETEN